MSCLAVNLSLRRHETKRISTSKCLLWLLLIIYCVVQTFATSVQDVCTRHSYDLLNLKGSVGSAILTFFILIDWYASYAYGARESTGDLEKNQVASDGML